MNDFTKEELQQIYLDMSHNILLYGKDRVDIFYLQLRDKIESMIDNYCEHKITCIPNESGHGHTWIKKCRKCGKDLK